MEPSTASPPPAKRRKLSNDMTGVQPVSTDLSQTQQPPSMTSAAETEREKELRSGITAFVHPDLPGFSGVLKQRYTDFLVNEILPNGQVLHLSNLRPPKQAKPERREQEQKQQQSSAIPPAVVLAEVKNSSDEQVVSTTDNERPQQQTGSQVPDDDRSTLVGLLGEEVTAAVIQLHSDVQREPNKKAKDHRKLQSEAIKDKDTRTQVHQVMRRIFNSKFETSTADNDCISITVAGPSPQGRGGGTSTYHAAPRGKLGWQDLGGEYLHFTMYKENKDTMEVMSFLAKELRVQPRSFQFSGTKDRRAVTVQRCSAYRLRAEQVAPINRKLRGSRIGDFEYHKNGLGLGELGGNEFSITLRECHFPGDEGLDVAGKVALAERVLTESVEAFRKSGYINYYGLQRFGSFSTSTDTVGTKMLQGDYAGAVADILSFSDAALAAAQNHEDNSLIGIDDKRRAEGLNAWLADQDQNRALDKIPYKFSAERSMITHLGKRNRGSNTFPNLHDYQGALGCITRNLRLMYVHAYQSLVWNTMAGKRLELYGHKVVEGDLVLVSEDKGNVATNGSAAPTHDEQGEPIVQVAPEDSATKADDFERARPLSAEEAASGVYSVFDLVLPLPGWDVVYPNNDVGKEYEIFMASDRGGGLDPHNMRRANRDLSLSGGYRKLLARPDPDMSFEVKPYKKVEVQLVQTDLEKLEKKETGGGAQSNGTNATAAKAEQPHDNKAEGDEKSEVVEEKIAVVLKMKLGSSQYATMALRELMKQGGVQAYMPDFGGGR